MSAGTARWLTRGEATDYLGLPDRQFDRLVAAGLIERTGKGAGRRYRSEDVQACGVLWSRLRSLLPPGKGPPEDEADED